jgi:Protein of unknown function (DUF3141)
VATKEDKELISFMDMIDVLPPGLYEAVITEVTDDTENRELISGRYRFSLEARTLGDIRALGGNDAADERRFATVRAVSEVNLGLYRTFLGPAVRNLVTEHSAALSRHMHPNRMSFEMFSDKNPLMQPVAAWADSIRAHRQPVSAGNPLLAMEQAASDWIVKCLDAFADARDAMEEGIFMATYDSPLLQALVGLRADGADTRRHVERELTREAAVQRIRAELNDRIEQGSLTEAALRALIYVRRPERTFDERSFTILKELNSEQLPSKRISLAKFKELMKEQYLIMMLDEERAAAAIPKLLPADRAERGAAMAVIRRILAARGGLPEEGKRRLARVEALFGETKADSSGSSKQLKLPAA